MERMTALEFKKWLEVRTREFAIEQSEQSNNSPQGKGMNAVRRSKEGLLS